MSVSIANTTSQVSGKTVVIAEGDTTVTGLHTFSRSTSAPFAVNAGAGNVANLDADKLDGQEGAYYTSASNLASGTVPDARMSGATFKAGDGTVSAPSLTFANETDCGLYKEGTNAIAAATNGVKALGIDSTQFIDSPTQPRCSAYSNATQSVSNNSATALTLNAEDFDIGTMHDNATNNTRLTVPTGGDGLYAIIGQTNFENASDYYAELRLRVNGTTEIAYSSGRANTSMNVHLQVQALYTLAAADYVELLAFQLSGSARNVGNAARAQASALQLVKLW